MRHLACAGCDGGGGDGAAAVVGMSGKAVSGEGVGGEGGKGAGGGGSSASVLRLRGKFCGCAASGILAAGGWCGVAHWM